MTRCAWTLWRLQPTSELTSLTSRERADSTSNVRLNYPLKIHQYILGLTSLLHMYTLIVQQPWRETLYQLLLPPTLSLLASLWWKLSRYWLETSKNANRSVRLLFFSKPYIFPVFTNIMFLCINWTVVCVQVYLPRMPNPYKKLLVTCSLAPPNPKCYVCSPKPEVSFVAVCVEHEYAGV